MPLSVQSTVSRNPDIASEEIDGDRVMMDLNEGSVFGLNPVVVFGTPSRSRVSQ